MPPLVSIITACYNSAETIVETINSVARQTYPNIEHIVVNDGSTDHVEALLAPYIEQGKIIYLNKSNGGVSSARNLGASLATGEFLVFLDADDQLKPAYIEKCAYHLINQPETSLAITGVQEFDAGHAQRLLKQFDLKQFLFENIIPCAAMLRRKDFVAYGPYDEGMSFAEDWNLWISILKHQPTVAIVPELLFLYRRHQSKQSLSVIADKQQYLLQKAHNQIYAHHSALYSRYIQDSPLTLLLKQQRTDQLSLKLYRKLRQQVRVASGALLLCGIATLLQGLNVQNNGGYAALSVISEAFLMIVGVCYFLLMKKSLQRSAKKLHRV